MDEMNNQNIENQAELEVKTELQTPEQRTKKPILKTAIMIGVGALALIAIALLLIFVVFKHEHNWSEWKTSKTPTCTEDGYNIKVCDGCAETQTTTIYATGHSYSNATCTAPQTCILCGETKGMALGHTYEKGICTVCNELNPSAKEEQLAICEEIIEDLETLETYCYAQVLAYQNAWYFAIYKADDYYSYESILSDFSTTIAIDSAYVNDATIDYLEDIGLEAKQINALAALRTNSGALGITERAIDLRWGMIGSCNELVSQITTKLDKINARVVGNDYAEAIADYCNVILNYYSFAKTPTGSYNTYTSQSSTYKTYCTNAKNALIIAKP